MNPDPGRSANGRFVNGNRHGRGNPLARRVQRLRVELLRFVSSDDLREVVAALIVKAKGGDVPAAKELLDRAIGKSTEGVDFLERLEALVNARGPAPHDVSDAVAALEESGAIPEHIPPRAGEIAYRIVEFLKETATTVTLDEDYTPPETLLSTPKTAPVSEQDPPTAELRKLLENPDPVLSAWALEQLQKRGVLPGDCSSTGGVIDV